MTLLEDSVLAGTRSLRVKALAVFLLLPVFSHAAGFEEAGAEAAGGRGAIQSLPQAVDAGGNLALLAPNSPSFQVGSVLPARLSFYQTLEFEEFMGRHPGDYGYLDPRGTHVTPLKAVESFAARGRHPVLLLGERYRRGISKIRLPTIESLRRVAAHFGAGRVERGYEELEQSMDGAEKGPLALDDPERWLPFERQFVLVPEGRFAMAGKTVFIPSFWLQKGDLTQSDFAETARRQPFHYWYLNREEIRKTPERPAENITFADAVAAANARSRLEGKPLHYAMSNVQKDPWRKILHADVAETGKRGGYYIPSEAELAYAAWLFTNGLPWDWDLHVWRRSNAEGKTHAGATRYPLGELYDLFGNVWKWTSTREGPLHVVRGGSIWEDGGVDSLRQLMDPGAFRPNVGVRLARSIP